MICTANLGTPNIIPRAPASDRVQPLACAVLPGQRGTTLILSINVSAHDQSRISELSVHTQRPDD